MSNHIVDVRLIDADALKVGPNEVLIVRLPGEHPSEVVAGLADALVHVGLEGRSLVIAGLDVELAVAKKDGPEEMPPSDGLCRPVGLA